MNYQAIDAAEQRVRILKIESDHWQEVLTRKSFSKLPVKKQGDRIRKAHQAKSKLQQAEAYLLRLTKLNEPRLEDIVKHVGDRATVVSGVGQ